jgi:hypothetical protein
MKTTSRLFGKSVVAVAAVLFALSACTLLRADPPVNHPDHWCKPTNCPGLMCRGFSICADNAWCDADPADEHGRKLWNKCLPHTGISCNEDPLTGNSNCPGFCTGGGSNGLGCNCNYGICPRANPN